MGRKAYSLDELVEAFPETLGVYDRETLEAALDAMIDEGLADVEWPPDPEVVRWELTPEGRRLSSGMRGEN